MILTLPRTQAPLLPNSGCWSVDSLAFLQPPLWRVRAEVEHDETVLQPIAYLLLRNPAGQVWCYQRTGGDTRVDGRWSCGVGGHVDWQDAPQNQPFDPEATLRQALLRELAEELQAGPADLQDLQLKGLIYEGLTPIGRVHLGVLYTATWCAPAAPTPRAGEALRARGFIDLSDVAADSRFELWSQLAAQHLI